jgi:hypothetical protein
MPETYLVEHYRPGLQIEELRQAVSRVRDATAALTDEGKPLRLVRSTIVPRDESFLFVFEAASAEYVREAHVRAGVPFDRISAAISEEG